MQHPVKSKTTCRNGSNRLSDRLMPGLERRLQREITGEVRFDPFTRGRYATDASHYQMMPVGVVTPKRSMKPIAR
jgi:hypothetical protein